MYKIFNFLASQEKLREMDSKDIGLMLHHVKAGPDVKKAAYEIPLIEIEASIQPITRTVLRVKLNVKPDFRYNFDSNQSVGFLQSSEFCDHPLLLYPFWHGFKSNVDFLLLSHILEVVMYVS